MFARAFVPVLAGLAIPVLVGCSGSDAPSVAGPTTGPTFHKDVEPTVQKHGQSCHSAGRIAPFTLTSYADAKLAAGSMVAQTQARTMPPWGAFETDECKPRFGWQDDKRLSEAEIATIAAW